MQRKTLLLASIAVTVAGLVMFFLLFWLPFLALRPHFSLQDKVETFYVHYENGKNMTIYPSTPEGGKLMSGSEVFMSNLYGQLLWAVSDQQIAIIRNSTEFVEIILKETCNFTFYVRASAVYRTSIANRILLIVSGSHSGDVLFARVEREEIHWVGAYGVDNGVKELQELLDSL